VAQIPHRLTDAWRKKVKVAEIMERLGSHVDGSIEMSQTQIAAAKILLAKTVPDITKNEHEHAGQVTVNIVKFAK
jgi:hypothetical protein